MKKLLLLLLAMATIPSLSHAEFDPKQCYKRCMEEFNDKPQCDYICYKKK